MISIPRIKCGIRFHDVFFASDPEPISARFGLAHLSQSAKPFEGFIPCATKIIDLSRDEGTLFDSLSSNTKYKIRRSEREGIRTKYNSDPSQDDINTFCLHFNPFARAKGLPLSNRDKLVGLKEASALILTQAIDARDATLVSHAYIADRELGRLRLLYSASHFRSTDNTEERNLIGRANRLLHWRSISGAKQHGYQLYDLGGLPLNQHDHEKNAIARFKNEFGGTVVTEYNGFITRNRLIQRAIPTVQRVFA